MTEPLHAYVGRQALFDRRLQVVGYELLYRNSEENRARFTDADKATAETMLNAFVELGLDTLAPGLPVWVNLPEAFLLGKYPIPLPADRTVLEVLEDVPVTPELIASLERYRADGYKIALDDFILTDATRPLLDLAWAIKVDVLNVPREEVARQFNELKPAGAIMVAEKISTHDEHVFLRDLGFFYFQGHFLEMPIVAKTKRMPHDRAALVKILSALYDAKLDLRAIETLVAAEVGLSARLFKLASSAAFSLGQPIGSVRQAVLRLGVQQVSALIVLIMVAGFDDKPLELARQALVRARMCEELAKHAKLATDQLFTAGLLSLLDAVLDRPLHEILAQMQITPLVREALEGTGAAANIVDTARHQARGELRSNATGLPAQAIFVAWYEAIRWADDVIAKI
ncbi:MAG TPA: HDOD domain-containing protein [Kofleriaceae bacterium]|jgi:EAL and modified HD-GYP domain-containing signal transduction protein